MSGGRALGLSLLLLAGCAPAPLRRDGEGWSLSHKGRLLARLRGPEPRPDGAGFRFQDGRLEIELPGPRGRALFPGLEYLDAEEASSPGRRRPDPALVTIPLIAVECGEVLVLLSWTGAARVEFQAGAGAHVVIDRASNARLELLPGKNILDAVPQWISRHGLPEPEPWPRAWEAERELCKTGFRSVAAPAGKHRAVAARDAPSDWIPGFGVLLHLLGETIDWDLYPDLLSTEDCRIMKWEAPHFAGETRLLDRLPDRVRINLGLRGEDGEWGYHPLNARERSLGRAGDSVLGTNSSNALAVAKAARLTGDAGLRDVAIRTLDQMRRHRIPRGGLAGQRPLQDPDLGSAAYAVGAYLEGYGLTRDPAQLAEAARWARAGLPFLRLQRGGAYEALQGFGSLATSPATGLVYAYYLRKLGALDRSLDWIRIADGILARALHRQRTDGPSAGCLPEPDSPDLNPEVLIVNLLAARGSDPDPGAK